MNILFTTLSTRSKNPYTCYYITDNCKDKERKGKYDTWCSGIHQQEPGAKKFLAEERIDKIVMFGSKATYDSNTESELLNKELPLKDWYGKLEDMTVEQMNQLSSFRFLICRLADFVYGKSENDEADSDSKKIDFTTKTDCAYASDRDDFDNYQNLNKLMPCAKQSEKSISAVFIPDRTNNDTENLKALIRELIKGADADHPNHLFMDMQGGERTKIYVNNALLQLLSNQDDVYFAKLERVVATQFDPSAVFVENKNRIIDETNRYRIVDLVSGMNAFLKYGKSDLLKDYVVKLEREAGFVVDESIKELIFGICDIDNAITYCRIKENLNEEIQSEESGTVYLMAAIRRLKNAIEAIDEKKSADKPGYIGNYFDILIDGIKSDFGKLLESDEIDVIALIDWCIKKNNYITATAIAEDSLPAYFVKHGILYYAKSKEELGQAEKYFSYQRAINPDRQKHLFYDINHFFVKNYLSRIKVYPYYEDSNLDIDYNNTLYLNLALKNCSRNNNNFPVSLYTCTKIVEETRLDNNISYPVREPLVNRVLTLYSFVSYNRNCLAHASNESGVRPKTLKKRFKELMDLIRKPGDLRPQWQQKQTILYLNDAVIRDKEDKIKSERNEMIKSEIAYEIRDHEYGIANYYVTQKSKLIRLYSEVYATHQILYALSGLAANWGAWKNLTIDNMQESQETVGKLLKFLADEKNRPFIELLIKYCNKNNNPVPQFANIKKSTEDYIQDSVVVEDADVLRIIKNEIHSLKDLYDKVQSYANLDAWNAFCAEKKEIIQEAWKQKGADDEKAENRAQLIALLSALKQDDTQKSKKIDVPEWKKIVSFFFDDEKSFDFLLKQLRLDRP